MYHHLGDFDYSCFCGENLGKSLFNRSIIAKDAKKDLKGRHYSYLHNHINKHWKYWASKCEVICA